MNPSNTKTTEKAELTVYYDGSCPLCSREIDWYKKRPGAESMDWCDVSAIDEKLVENDLATKDAMERFHVRKQDGTLIDGALAFSELWSHIPALRIVGRVTKLPGIRHIAEIVYKLFLRVRSMR